MNSMDNSTKDVMLTTTDNPYNYFTNFDEWYLYDTTHGSDLFGKPYDCLNYLARIAKTTNELSDADNDDEITRAIDTIIKHDPIGIFTKCFKPSEIKKSE